MPNLVNFRVALLSVFIAGCANNLPEQSDLDYVEFFVESESQTVLLLEQFKKGLSLRELNKAINNINARLIPLSSLNQSDGIAGIIDLLGSEVKNCELKSPVIFASSEKKYLLKLTEHKVSDESRSAIAYLNGISANSGKVPLVEVLFAIRYTLGFVPYIGKDRLVFIGRVGPGDF